MGKRELLLIAAFVLVGFVVYQVTSPPRDPGRRSWSFAGIMDEIRREVRGNQARAESTNTQVIPAPATLREIRLVNHPSEVAVIGEDRADVEAVLKVNSRGYDDAEAKRTAQATKLLVDPAGELLTLTMDYPPEGRQTATLSLKVPKRLALRIDEKGGSLTVLEVAAVTLGPSRGATVLTNIPGRVQVVQRGSTLTISNVGPLRVNTVSAETVIGGVRGGATLNFQGGDIRAEAIEGAIELEGRNADMTFGKLEKASGPNRFNTTGGQLIVTGLTADTRIDARRTEVRVEQAAVATLAVYAEGETAEVTTAAGGLTIDALAVIGRITLDAAWEKMGLAVATTKTGGDSNGQGGREESRLTGKVNGGGPTVTLRTTRGDINLRSR